MEDFGRGGVASVNSDTAVSVALISVHRNCSFTATQYNCKFLQIRYNTDASLFVASAAIGRGAHSDGGGRDRENAPVNSWLPEKIVYGRAHRWAHAGQDGIGRAQPRAAASHARSARTGPYPSRTALY
jgi:hypothetical protein